MKVRCLMCPRNKELWLKRKDKPTLKNIIREAAEGAKLIYWEAPLVLLFA